MCRPIVSLSPYLWRALLPMVLVTVLIGIGNIGLAGLLCFIAWRRNDWLWRLIAAVRRFRTSSDSRVVLHYDPACNAQRIPDLMGRLHHELDLLAVRFGKPLRGRAVVFLVGSHKDVSRIIGYAAGGYALWHANVILIAADQPTDELVRHELAHLFSGRWSKHAPPLLSEGLSVCLQGTERGYPIDTLAQPLLDNRRLRLSDLLNRRVFFSESQRLGCYVLAGSFTRFLIRRYGWNRFERRYRSCNGYRFGGKFKKHIGVMLERAEWSWRNDVMIPAILRRRMWSNVR